MGWFCSGSPPKGDKGRSSAVTRTEHIGPNVSVLGAKITENILVKNPGHSWSQRVWDSQGVGPLSKVVHEH